MMNRLDIIRAWKDEEYRSGLTEAERAALPENPAGLVELSHEQMEGAAGGNNAGGLNSSPLVCQVIRSFACPKYSVLPHNCVSVNVCPNTSPVLCKPSVGQLCVRFTVACPRLSHPCRPTGRPHHA